MVQGPYRHHIWYGPCAYATRDRWLDQPGRLPACNESPCPQRGPLPAMPPCCREIRCPCLQREILLRERVVSGKLRGASRCRCGAHRPKGRPKAPAPLPLGPGRTSRTATHPLGVPPGTFTAEWQCELHSHSALGAPSALPLAPWARRFGAFDTEWQCETHCHSPPERADRANRTATRPPAHRVTLPLGPGRTSRTATRPWAFRPVRSPSSGSVNHTSTRPWAYQAHCHSPLGRADRANRTATRS